MGGWREAWETTGFDFDLSPDGANRLRARIRAERGEVTRFTVQYEVVAEGATYAAVRYDSAHGRPHRDILDRRGRVIEKTWIVGKTYKQIVTEAIADVKANWPTYRARFEQEHP